MTKTRIRLLGGLGGCSLLTFMAGPALAQADSECLRDLADVEARQVGVMEHLSSFERRSMTTLRNAVHVLVRTGHDDACEEVVEAVAEILGTRRDELVDSGVMVDVDDQERVTQLETAPQVTELEQPLRAGNMIGGSLRNTRDEHLGEISDVVFDPETNQITHVLAEVGGFLGLGQDVVAVPLSALRVTDDHETYVLAMTPERLEEAPRVQGDTLQQPDWAQENDMYYALGSN
jgi:sporulation protein YlmC with PRC-barrel domain